MVYQLTDHQKSMIDNSARAFWADLKIGILRDYDSETCFKNSGNVFMYVDAWQGFLYFSSLGHFENPDEVRKAVEEYEGFKNRSPVSASETVRTRIAGLHSE